MIKYFYLIFLASLVSVSCANGNALLMAKEPEVLISQVEFIDWVGQDLTLDITFSVDNPNNIDVDIEAVRYEMKVMERSVAKDYRDLFVAIKANEISEIKLPVKLNAVELFSSFPEALLTNKLSYSLSGAVKVKGLMLQLPFSKQGVFSVIPE